MAAVATPDYDAVLRDALAAVKECVTGEAEAAGFTFVKEDQAIRIYKKDNHVGALTLVRAECVFEGVTAQQYAEFLNNNELRMDCDGTKVGGKLMASTVVEALDANTQVIRRAFAMPTMITNRDAVLVHRLVTEPSDEGASVYWSVSKSVEHAAAPIAKGFERMSIHVLGFRVEPLATGCRVTYVNCTDPSGWLPTAVVNSQVASGPLFLKVHERFVAGLPK
eukprot:a344172_78.p2 GENE.a344172_78~~a344172_78.p2  ORF type:complete len:231 (+),score=74.05 a344172_78:29-694(+)